MNKVKAIIKPLEFATTFRAMNTDVELLIYVSASQYQRQLFQERFEQVSGRLQLLFSEAEACLSRFREDSELSCLNRQGHISDASNLLYASISTALVMADLSGGIFEPTILDALENAGYNRSFELLGQEPALVITRAIFPTFNGYQGVKLEPVQRAITLPYATHLDLGGIAKGMTVDRAAGLLRQAGFHNFMISAGGDMFLSGYCDNGNQNWTVEVLDPVTLEGNLAALTVSNQAVATSATTRRCWQVGQQIRHHLIDPRTGQSVANGLAAVTVVAPTTQLADVLAKTALILGLEEGQAFLERQKGCAGLFITLERQLISSSSLVITEYKL